MTKQEKLFIIKGYISFLKAIDEKSINYSVFYGSIKHLLELLKDFGIGVSNTEAIRKLSYTFNKELEFAAVTGDFYDALLLIKSNIIAIDTVVEGLKIDD